MNANRNILSNYQDAFDKAGSGIIDMSKKMNQLSQ